jgi:hypothetical protein
MTAHRTGDLTALLRAGMEAAPKASVAEDRKGSEAVGRKAAVAERPIRLPSLLLPLLLNLQPLPLRIRRAACAKVFMRRTWVSGAVYGRAS